MLNVNYHQSRPAEPISYGKNHPIHGFAYSLELEKNDSTSRSACQPLIRILIHHNLNM